MRSYLWRDLGLRRQLLHGEAAQTCCLCTGWHRKFLFATMVILILCVVSAVRLHVALFLIPAGTWPFMCSRVWASLSMSSGSVPHDWIPTPWMHFSIWCMGTVC